MVCSGLSGSAVLYQGSSLSFTSAGNTAHLLISSSNVCIQVVLGLPLGLLPSNTILCICSLSHQNTFLFTCLSHLQPRPISLVHFPDWLHPNPCFNFCAGNLISQRHATFMHLIILISVVSILDWCSTFRPCFTTIFIINVMQLSHFSFHPQWDSFCSQKRVCGGLVVMSMVL
jgi:hypothetical protein